MTENTTIPSNVMEHVEPRQPAVGGGSQAYEGIGLTTAKKKKKKVKYNQSSRIVQILQTVNKQEKETLKGGLRGKSSH
jgi:hypothetical protein